jgi:hypothetical protein
LKTSYTKIRELPTAWFEFLADQRPLSDIFRRLENGRFRHGLLRTLALARMFQRKTSDASVKSMGRPS